MNIVGSIFLEKNIAILHPSRENRGTSSKTKEEEEKLIFMDGEHKWDWHNNMRNPTIILPGPGSI